MKFGAFFDRNDREQRVKYPEEHGVFHFDEDDYLLAALLQDPVYAAELMWDDPANREYRGAYVVRDYQYPLFRVSDNYAGFTCARSVGKTESIKARSFVHAFRRIAENLLVSAPELIHLLPLTDAIEDRIRSCRLTRDFLDVRGGKTGFTHRPFGVDFLDGTKIVGRIPRLTGTGVKGQHQPDLIIDEGQDYPEKGWVEVHETVLKDHVDQDGDPDFTYHFYGVHTGARDSGFHKRSAEGGFTIIQVTAMQRPGWNAAEKTAAKAAYGGTSSSDYRRNILGEPGAASSAFFVTSRLVACVDQDRESRYNETEYRHQQLKVEEFDEMMLPIGEVLDLPGGPKEVYGGMDVGLTNSPTVIMLFSRERSKGNGPYRMKLIRRFTLERMRTRQIREALYAIDRFYGSALKGFGMDVTGLGFPMWQEMEDDESAPPHLMEVARGYFFNAKVPVGVERQNVTQDERGRMRDQFGSSVVEEIDPNTGQVRYVTYMPMIEASTRYLREMVASTYLLLPFDTEITGDMQGETQQRVKRIAGLKAKPNAFHILDAMRAFAMPYKSGAVEAELALDVVAPVLDVAL
jgi:hypothetical protein